MVGSMRSEWAHVPQEIAASGAPVDLCEQFVLSRSVDPPADWESDLIGSWRLARHPTLPAIVMVDRAGARLGWLLGYPITSDGRLLVHASSEIVGPDVDQLAFVHGLGGRFLAIFADVDAPAIFPDAAGSYSSVFCPSLEMAASTPALIPYEATTLDHTELMDQPRTPRLMARFLFGLTPRHGIERLLPNHHLDLDRWESVRHGPTWPRRGSVGIEESADRVAEITRRNMAAVMDRYPCYLPLTAGNDSRMLLSCARERSGELGLYTLEIPDVNGANDVHVATRISRRFGLSHQRIGMLTATPEDLRRWLYQTGCTVSEPRGCDAITTYRSLDRSRARFVAQIGDFSRGVYRTKTDREDTVITPERLALHGLGLTRGVRDPSVLTAEQRRTAALPTVLERAELWQRNSCAPDSLALLDLAYIENALACWAGVWPYAEFTGPGFTIFPMCHREIIDLILALPEQTRTDETFMQIVIQRQWPELLDWPINTTSRRVRFTYFPYRVARGLRRRTSQVRRSPESAGAAVE
jgi:hypothetical protein